jgi:prepilin-type N-terminal cleavage/methylation domain-containing protein
MRTKRQILTAKTPRAPRRTAFTLIEILVAMALMSLIVLALMAVFNSTQTAFRAGLTQTDVLEGGRATIDLIKSDLETMTPSLAPSNVIVNPFNSGSITNNVNFYVAVTNYTSPPSPLYQSLVGSNQQRTNVLEKFFVLSRGNVNGSPSWIGTGYEVSPNLPDGTLYPLYRFYMTTNTTTGNPAALYNAFAAALYNASPSFLLTNSSWSHLVDGVVELRLRAYDTNGVWIEWQNGLFTNKNTYPSFLQSGETGFYMFSNMVPASVEVEMGVIEDRTLQRAESFSASFSAQTNYLAQHVGQVHIFRQRVPIRNVDPSAYK